MKRIVAGILCGVMLFTGSGMEQIVYAAQETEVSEVSKPEEWTAPDNIEDTEKEQDVVNPFEDTEDTDEKTPETDRADEDSSSGEDQLPPETASEGDTLTEGDGEEDAVTEYISDEDVLENVENDSTQADADGFVIGADGVLTAYTGTAEQLTIPGDVTKIADKVFQGNTALTAVTFPEGLTSIGEYAFDGCSGLTSITLPDSLTEIGRYAFNQCTGLTGELIIPDQVEVLDMGIFARCTGLTKVTIGKGVKSAYVREKESDIRNFCGPFYTCYNLNTVIFLSETVPFVSYREDTDKKDLSGLSNLIPFNDSMTVTVPIHLYGEYSVELGRGASGRQFYVDTEFENPDGLVIKDSVLVSYQGEKTSVQIPEVVKRIGAGAFINNKSLEAVTFPESLESIEPYAFCNCVNLTGELVLPENLKMINEGAFAGCIGLTGTLVIPDQVKEIYEIAFDNCKQLTNITIGSGVTHIWVSREFEGVVEHGSPFRGCSKVTKIKFLSKMVPVIGLESDPENQNTDSLEAFFQSFSQLKEIIVPENCLEKYRSAYGSYLPEGTEIKESVSDFEITNGVLTKYKGDGRTVVIPGSVTEIAAEVFMDNTAITKVIFPQTLTKIGGSAFYGCTELKKADFPESLTEIAEEAFCNTGLTGELKLPEGLQTLGDGAFCRCPGLTGTLIIPDQITTIGNSVFGITGFDTIRFPDTLTSIGPNAFRECEHLTGVLKLPNTLETIGEHAFDGCTGLTGELVIPPQVTRIETAAFAQCGFTGTLTIPDHVTNIGKAAFAYCKNLSEIILGSGLKDLGANANVPGPQSLDAETYGEEDSDDSGEISVFGDEQAFYHCVGVHTVTFNGTVPPVLASRAPSRASNSFFSLCFENLKTIWVPDGYYETYARAYRSDLWCGLSLLEKRWKGNTDPFLMQDGILAVYQGSGGNVKIPDSVTVIGPYAFMNREDITGVTFPKNIQSIGAYAFVGCGLQGTLTIPDTINVLNKGIFAYCYKLTHAVISSEVTHIYAPEADNYDDYSAFARCDNMETITFSGKTPPVINSKVTAEENDPDSIYNFFSDIWNLATVLVPSGCAASYISAYEKGIPDYLADRFLFLEIGREDFRIKGNVLLEYVGIETEVTIPDFVTEIGSEAFKDNTTVEAIHFPKDLTVICDYAFDGCTGLKGVPVLPDSLVTLGKYAFRGCTGLTGELVIPDKVKILNEGTFYGCTGLTSVVIGSGVRNISSIERKKNVFFDCSNIKYIKFKGNTVPVIAADVTATISEETAVEAFFDGIKSWNGITTHLTLIIVPNADLTAYTDAYEAHLPTDVRIKADGSPDFVCEGTTLIAYNGLDTHVTVPSNITQIGDNAFKGNKALESITFPDGLTLIGNSAFENCKFLTGIDFPDKLETIGVKAFYMCSNLTGDLIIPDSVKTIGASAFASCYTLTGTLKLSKNLARIASGTFQSCSLTGTLELPDGLKRIDNYAFQHNDFIGSLVIPNSVTTIGDSAFASCVFDGSLTLSNNIESIGENAFNGCSGLTGTLTVPGTLNSIGLNAFNNMASISAVIVEAGVQHINASDSTPAFRQGKNIESITFLGDRVPVISYRSDGPSIEATFSRKNLPNLKHIYVPSDALALYTEAWGDYLPKGVSISSDSILFPVTGLGTEYIRSHSVKLTWTASGYEGIAGYYIDRDGVRIADVQEPFYEDTDLASDASYTYTVTGHSASDPAEVSRPASLTVSPARPEVLSIYTDNGSNWVGQAGSYLCAKVKDTQNLDGGIGVFYYLDKNNEKRQIGDVLSGYTEKTEDGCAIYQIPWTVTDIKAGEYTVYFEFTDKDGGFGMHSGIVRYVNTRPAQLSSVVAYGDTNKICLSWTIAHEETTEKYHIYRRMQDEDTFTLLEKIEGRNTLSYDDTNVNENTAYYYYVVGVDVLGQEGEPSNIVSAVRGEDSAPPQIVKLLPVNNSVIGGTEELYTQAWDEVAVVRTELFLSTDGGKNWTSLASAPADQCSYTLDTSQYEDSTIQIKGMASDGRNESDGLIYTYMIDNTGPAQVTGLRCDEKTATSITLRWDDVPDNDFAFFRVEQKLADGNFKKVQDVYRTLGVNLFNLESNTEYCYRVAAYDQFGNRGTASNELAVVTLEDTVAPVVTRIKPDPGYYKDAIEVEITASDNTGVQSLKIQTSYNMVIWEDYKTLRFDGINRTQTVRENISLDDFQEGYLYIRGVATDIKGNVGDSSEAAPYVQYVVDRTPPAVPQNFRVNAAAGAIEAVWDMGKEPDLDQYTLYRSVNGTEYAAVAEGLYTVNYWDRAVEKGVEYFYRLEVRDKAGNVSARTEAVRGILPDDTVAPEIRSCQPAGGSVIGRSNRTFSVLVSDNWKVDKVLVTYTVNEGQTVYTLLSRQGINEYYKVVDAEIPVERLQNNDHLTFTVTVTDVQGLKTVQDGIQYTVDKEAPVVRNVSAEGDAEKMIVRWEGNGEDDLAGYQIYRRQGAGKYSMIAYRKAGETCEYQDEDVKAGGSYTYKVEAADRFGNTYAEESGSVSLAEGPKVRAELRCDTMLEADVRYCFDGTGSSAECGITSYQFDFGDGTVETLDSTKSAKIYHSYQEVGSYTITLTVTDKTGETAISKQEIQVKEAVMLGTVTVKVTGENGVLSGMPVYFAMGDPSQRVSYTNEEGLATFKAEVGSYEAGSYADGYLPTKRSVVVRANKNTELVLQMVKEPIVTGEFEIQRMTLDEIVAAGIDISEPANQHVMKIVLHLTYDSKPVNMNIITNGSQILSGGHATVGGGNGSESGGGGGARELTAAVIRTSKDSIALAVMDVPVEVSFLKEFFDVKLHIINHAGAEFALNHNKVTLQVPDGMSVVNGSNTVGFASLQGQQEHTVSWTLRGDNPGSYDLRADYRGILGQFNEPVQAVFETASPIRVYGYEAMNVVADINYEVAYGGMYFDLSVVNTSDTEIYLPTMDIMGEIMTVCEYDRENESFINGTKTIKLLNQCLKKMNGNEQYIKDDSEIRVLPPGCSWKKRYVCYNSITTEDLAYLQSAIYSILEGSIPVQVNISYIDLFSANDAEKKFESIFSGGQKLEVYEYLLNDQNFYYYKQALDNESFWNTLGHKLHGVTDCVLNLNPDVWTHDTEKEVTRQYIYELLKDESFQQSVDQKIDTTYMDTTQTVISNIKGFLADDKSDEFIGPDFKLENPDSLKDFNDALSEAATIRSLMEIFRTEGEKGLEDRLVSLALSSGGAACVEYVKALCEKNFVSDMVLSGLKDQLSEVSDILDQIGSISSAWNKSAEITNQLITINASQSQALALMDTILANDTTKNTAMYEEVQTLRKGLTEGFGTQGDAFIKLLADDLKDDITDAVVNKAIIGSIDKTYFSNASYGVGTVMTTMKVAFGTADYVMGWKQDANIYTRLNSISLISLSLSEELEKLKNTPGAERQFLSTLKYLIKARLEGESDYVELIGQYTGIKSDYKGEKVLAAINQETGGQYGSLNDYYLYFRELILSYRDLLYDEIPVNVSRPAAPGVSINYTAETTQERFGPEYEYSFDGSNWQDCDGLVIRLSPGSVARHLWIRKKASGEQLSGNIQKLYIPARKSLTENAVVRYKNGVYYIDGLQGTYTYQLSDEQLGKLSTPSSFSAENGTTTEIRGDSYHPWFAIFSIADQLTFASSIHNVPVHRPMTLSVANDEESGTVQCGGEYFEGEIATVSVRENPGYVFAGWYQNGELMSAEKEYSIYIYSDTRLEARYTALAHRGGTATCVSRAVCEDCGEPYGDLDPDNHTGNTFIQRQKDASCTEDGYTGDVYCADCKARLQEGTILEKIPHVFADGVCIVCGERDPEHGFYLTMEDTEELCYTGSARKPTIQVYDGSVLLRPGVDYTVTYANNIQTDQVEAEGGTGRDLSDTSGGFNSQLPYVVISGKGNYRATIYANFHIRPASVSNENGGIAEGFALKYTDQFTVNTKKAQKPFQSIRYKKTLTADDYTLTLTALDATDANGKALSGDMEGCAVPAGASGIFRMTLTGVGNYTGTLEKMIYAAEKGRLLKSAVVTIGKQLKNVDYTGSPITLTPGYYDADEKVYYRIAEDGNREAASKDEVFTVRQGKNYLIYGQDYTVRYENNLAAGTAALVMEGITPYVGTKEASFKIRGIALKAKDVTAEGLKESCVYTGSEITQDTVSLIYKKGSSDEKALVSGKDYTVSYKRNTAKGTAAMTFQMLPASGFTGKLTKTFKITAAELDASMLSETMENLTVPYTKAGAKPEPELIYNGITLQAGKDYKASYQNNKAAASSGAQIQVTGKGNYAGTLSIPFTIRPASFAEDDTVSIQVAETAYKANRPETYAYTPKIKVLDGKKALKAGADYEVSGPYNNTQADVTTYLNAVKGGADADTLASMRPYVEITAAGNNYTGTVQADFPVYEEKLTSKNLYIAVSSDETERTWAGEQVTPTAEVYYGGAAAVKNAWKTGRTDGLTRLTEGTDYQVSYGENKTVGKNKGSITVKGQPPCYGGSVTVKFTILGKEL